MSSEDYSLALTPEQAISAIVQLTAAMLASGQIDIDYQNELLAAVTKAEFLFNEISRDVFVSINSRPDLFKLSCD
jgi:hypothetical protein